MTDYASLFLLLSAFRDHLASATRGEGTTTVLSVTFSVAKY
jgi:hypothetical protein